MINKTSPQTTSSIERNNNTNVHNTRIGTFLGSCRDAVRLAVSEIIEGRLTRMSLNPASGLNLTEFVPEILRRRPNKPLSARQIADLVKDDRPEAWAAKQERAGHTDTEARNQVAAEIGSHRHDMQRRFPEFTWFEEPHGQRVRRQFAWIIGTEEEKEAEAGADADRVALAGLPASDGIGPGVARLQELDLYPLLATWLLSEFDIRSMRLGESRAAASAPRGTNWNRWLFPDVVGVEDSRNGWHPEIRDFAQWRGAPRCRMWSFEVKLLINRANIREYYLQAVSNSSWANRGYLVAAKVSSDEVTREELSILAETHGIGVIALDANDIANSEIIIQARERTSIDWRACERLFSANQDFQVFLKKVLRLHQTDELPSNGWLVDVEDTPSCS